jgi:hypothetical protein
MYMVGWNMYPDQQFCLIEFTLHVGYDLETVASMCRFMS